MSQTSHNEPVLKQRKIIFSAAMSLDGYIADFNDGYGWIVGDGDHQLDTLEQWDYPDFLNQVDTVIMGRRCFDLGQHKDFKDQTVIVASHQDLSDPAVIFTHDPIKTLNELKTQDGKNIFVFGGASLFQTCLEADLIDSFILGIVPCVLGQGIRLFKESSLLRLHLVKQTIEEGIVVLTYLNDREGNES